MWLAGSSACGRDRSAPEPAQVPAPAVAARADAAVLRLLVVGALRGMLEPCGCGKHPLGGIDRLATAIAAARADATPTLLLFAGDLYFAPRAGTEPLPMQAQYQAQTLASIVRTLHPDALVPGLADYAQGANQLYSLARIAGAPQLGAGIVLGDEVAAASPSERLQPALLRALGDLRVGISAVVAEPAAHWPAAARGPVDPAAEASRQVQALRDQGAQLVVLSVQAEPQLAAQIAAKSGAQLVIASGPAGQSSRPTQLAATTLLQAGEQGEGLWVVDLRLAAHQPASISAHYQPIDASVPADPAVRAQLTRLFARINAHNAQLQTQVQPPPKGVAAYVGSRTCAACHTQAFFWWRSSAHGRAYETLRKRGRELDLDCVGCHVTGFERPGGSTVTHLDELEAVGCESCHGPGSLHVDSPASVRVNARRSVAEQVCTPCHDALHSEAFVYATYRARLLVPGHLPAPRESSAQTAARPSVARVGD